MKKSLKWLAIQGTQYGVFGLFMVLAWMQVETVLDNQPLIDVMAAIAGVTVFCWPIIIYFMYRWVTAYNLEHFGYKSRSEWKKARQDEPE